MRHRPTKDDVEQLARDIARLLELDPKAKLADLSREQIRAALEIAEDRERRRLSLFRSYDLIE